MKILYTPSFFNNFDLAISLFSFVILVLFFIFSWKNYRLSKNKKMFYLSSAFLLIAFAEFASILAKFIIFYDINMVGHIGQVIITYTTIKSTDILYDLGFFIHKLFTLMGFYIVYLLSSKNKINLSMIPLVLLFLFISSLVGQMIFFVFHIAVIILLLLIVNNYLKIYKSNKFENTKYLLIAFILLLASHILFLVSPFVLGYITAQIIQLVGYVTLLYLIIRILNDGK